MFTRSIPFGFPEMVQLRKAAELCWNANFIVTKNENLTATADSLFSVVNWRVDSNRVEFQVQKISRRETMWFHSDDVIGVECLGYYRWKPIYLLKQASNNLILPDLAPTEEATLNQDGMDWWNHKREYLQNGFSEVTTQTKLSVIAAHNFNHGEHQTLVYHICTSLGEAYDVPEYFIDRG